MILPELAFVFDPVKMEKGKGKKKDKKANIPEGHQIPDQVL